MSDDLSTYLALGLAPHTAHDLDRHADAIITIARRSILEIGQHLLAAREIATHGSWTPFLQRIGFEERTAQNYMNVARKFQDNPEIISALPPTAVYLLAAPRADPAAVAAIVADVSKGARPKVEDIRQRLAAPPPAAPPPAAMPARRLPIPPPQAPARSAASIEHAKYAILRAACDVAAADVAELEGASTLNHEHVYAAARLLLESPVLGGAAAMLAWGSEA